MVSAKFSVVLIAVAVVLCAQLAASANKHKSGSNNHHHGNNGGHGHPTHPSPNHNHPSGNSNHPSGNSDHPSGNSNHPSGNSNHPSGNSNHPSNGGSSDLGPTFNHYDNKPSNNGGSGNSNNEHGSSSSSGQDNRRGRGEQVTDGSSPSHKDHSTPASSTKRPRIITYKITRYQKRNLAKKLTPQARQARRTTIRKVANEVSSRTKTTEKKTTESKKGLLNALSKQLSQRTGRNIDLGLIWAKLKNSTKECAKDSKDSILDFVTDTVSKSVFGECTEAEKYAKLQKQVDDTKETLRALPNKEKAQLETCTTEEGAMSILDRKVNPPKKTVTEAPPPIVTKKESESVLEAASNTTPEPEPEITFEDNADNDEGLFRRKRDDSDFATLGDLVDECRETVRNNTLQWTFKLNRDITSLTKLTKEIDKNDVEKCWSANFGRNLGTAAIGLVVNTLGCLAVGGP